MLFPYSPTSPGRHRCSPWGRISVSRTRYEALAIDGTQELESTGLYVQDGWQLGQWRFDLGARWDNWDGSGPLPTLDLSFDRLSPRLGATYNIDDNWQVQVTYGEYSSRFNDGVAGNVTGISGAPRIETAWTGPLMTGLDYAGLQDAIRDDDNWQNVLTVNDPAQPTSLLAEEVEAPYSTDLTLAVKRALPRNSGAFSVTYSRRQYKNLLDDFKGDNGTVMIDEPNNPGVFFGEFDLTIWDNSTLARRDYQAITATWDYRPGIHWNIGGNYTWSETTGNYEGEGRNTPSSGSIIGDYVRSVPQAAAVPTGFLDEDLTHRMKIWGNYRFDFDRAGALSLGSIFTYQSGAAWSRTAGLPMFEDDDYLNEDGLFYTHFFDGRGNNRFNSFWRIDFSARYTFQVFRDDVSAWVKLDALNLLDRDGLITYRNGGSVEVTDSGLMFWEAGSSFGAARNEDDYQDPRTYLVTLGIQF
jgi:hypothetical protein